MSDPVYPSLTTLAHRSWTTLALGVALAACSGPPPVEPPAPTVEVTTIGPNRFAVGQRWWESNTTDDALFGGPADAMLSYGDGLVIAKLGLNARLGRLGLREGDRVRAIRGHAPRSPEHARELWSTLGPAPAFTIEILRQGQPVTLIYEVQQDPAQ